MAALIALGTTETTFAAGEFIVAAGTPKTILLAGAANGGAPSGVEFVLAHKNAAGVYTTLVTLNAGNYLGLGQVAAAGTYALRRLASGVAASADVE